jgi:hypothetical protein
LVWVAALITWWFFSYRVALGPLVAGSAIEIDGKPLATLPHAAAEYSTLLSRGQHTLVVRAAGHTTDEVAFRIGWTGLRRRFIISQAPEIACVTLAGPTDATVTVGASWPDRPARNEYCAPVGTHAVAEWRTDATQPPDRQDFQYANDGDVVDLAAPAMTAPAEPASSPAAPAGRPTPAGSRLSTDPARAQELVRSAEQFFAAGKYAEALAACTQAEQVDPNSGAARALADKIRKTQAVLEGR